MQLLRCRAHKRYQPQQIRPPFTAGIVRYHEGNSPNSPAQFPCQIEFSIHEVSVPRFDKSPDVVYRMTIVAVRQSVGTAEPA